MYVGTNSTTLGAVSKIQLNSDTNVKTYNAAANIPAGGSLLVDEDTKSLAVGYNLEAVGSAASGVKSMGADNNATATTGSFYSETYTLPKNIGSAVLWASPVTDSSDVSNTVTVKASNDGGATYATCTLVSTDTRPAVPEGEYACTFAASGNSLKVRFDFARGSTKTNTYVTQYGITWLGQTGFRVEQTSANNVRLYNYTGESQNLRLDVLTGGLGRNLGTVSLAPSAADVDTQTGMNSIWINKTGTGGNLLKLQLAGADKFVVDTSGNLSMGGSLTITGAIKPGGNAGTSGYVLTSSGGGVNTWTDLSSIVGGSNLWQRSLGSVAPINITDALNIGDLASNSALVHLPGTVNQNAWFNLGTGNVGIGTTSPATIFEIDKASSGNTVVMSGYNTNTGILSADSASLQLGRRNGAAGASKPQGEIRASNMNNGSFAEGYLSFLTRKSETMTEYMRITNNGDIGFGTTAPTAKLDVSGNLNVSSYATMGASLAVGYANAPAGPGNAIFSGKVGIGTSAPAFPLDVAGDINITGTYRVNGSPLSTSNWQRSLGSLAPLNITDAVNVGAIASTSALVHLPGTVNQNAWFNLGTGNVGIGTTTFDVTNPEKLLVDAGVATSVNVISGKGSINNYLQLNIQNRSSGTSASSDVVATADNGSETTNFIDMGINGSGYTAGVFGAANDGYLYNIGGNMNIGTGTAGKSLAFLTGGQDVATYTRMFINSAGNVGIGTTGPSALLTLYRNDTTTTNQERIEQAGAGDATLSFALTGQQIWMMGIDNSDSDKFKITSTTSADVGSGTVLTIDTSGNVGIGTTGPGTRLAIADTSPILRLIDTQQKTPWAVGDVLGTLSYYTSDASGIGTHEVAAIQAIAESAQDTPTVGLGFWTGGFNAAATEKMRILNSGNVGIGTTSPTAGNLDVHGTTTGRIEVTADGTNNYAQVAIAPNGTGLAYLTYGTTGGNSLQFYSRKTAVGNVMTIDASGNVGIGTTNPGYKLDVAGDVNITGAYRVNGSLLTASNWQRSLGSLAPLNITDAVNVGAIASTSALVHLPGTINQNAWFNLGTGNVGIGTTNPNYKLEVNSSGINGVFGNYPNARVALGTSGTNAANIYLMSGIGGDVNSYTLQADNTIGFSLRYKPSDSPLMTVNSTGNVGIGTTGPTSKLQVETNTNGSDGIYLKNLSTGANARTSFSFDAGNGDATGWFGALASTYTEYPAWADSMVFWANSAASGGLVLGTSANSIRFMDSTSNEVMRIKSGNVGIGTTAPLAKLAVNGGVNIGADADPGDNNLNVEGKVGAIRFEDKNASTYYVTPGSGGFLAGNLRINIGSSLASTPSTGMISFTNNIDGVGSVRYASMSADVNGVIFLTGGTTVGNAGTNVCIGDPTNQSCNGKIDAGTIDPPYTINGKRYSTYVASMTGVKEETTGLVALTTKSKTVSGYEYVIDFNAQADGSDLWLFAKTTALQARLERMSVLMSPSDSARTWYKIDSERETLTFYSSRPTTISYRLTAPRFDDTVWKNVTPNGSGGWVINELDVASKNTIQVDGNGNIAGQLVATGGNDSGYQVLDEMGAVVEETVLQAKTISAHIVAGLIQAEKIISPVIETEMLTATKSIAAPSFTTNEIQIGTKSGSLAALVIRGLDNAPVVSIDNAGNATFAGTLTAKSLETENASVSGTLIAKNIQSENINALADQVSSNSSTLATNYQLLTTNINAVQSELANLKNQPLANPAYYQNIDASYDTLTVNQTANIYKAHIADSLMVGTLYIQPTSILALSSDLHISSLGTISLFDDAVVIAKNGDMAIKGEVSMSALAIKNVEGVTVASIDASGSATFNEVIARKFSLENIATQGAFVADSGMYNESGYLIPAIKTSTEVAGIGSVPQDAKEVIIYNDNVTDNSLIYLTPTTENIQGQLSVTKKISCTGESRLAPTECAPYFVVSSTNPIHSTSSFNWLIIN